MSHPDDSRGRIRGLAAALRRLASRTALLGAILLGAARGAAAQDDLSVSDRIERIRDRLQSFQATDAPESDEVRADLGSWCNGWRNWNNWGNWSNWSNWCNW